MAIDDTWLAEVSRNAALRGHWHLTVNGERTLCGFWISLFGKVVIKATRNAGHVDCRRCLAAQRTQTEVH